MHAPRLHIRTLQGMVINLLKSNNNYEKGDIIYLHLNDNLIQVMVRNNQDQRFFAMQVTTENLIKKDVYDV